jgi:multiple sugar transport system substrate-binding protein
VEVEKLITATPPPNKKQITIRYQEKAPVQGWTEQLVLPIFEDKFPWIKVVFEPRVPGWIEKNLAMMAAGTAPDIIHAWGEVFQRYSSKRQLLDLSPMIESGLTKEELDDQHKFQWDAFWDPFNKIRFAIGRQVDVQFLFYNKDIFDKQGVPYPNENWTYDDLASIAQQVTIRDASGNTNVWGAYTILDSWTFLSTHLNAFGGHIRDDETWMKCCLNEPEAKQWFQWQQDRIFKDKTWLNSTTISGTGASGDYVGMFASEMYAMAEITLNSIGQISQDAKFNWGIAPPPIGPAGRYGLGDNDGFAVYKGVAKNGDDAVEASWEFVKFMNGPFFQRANMEQTGELPGRRSMMDNYVEIIKRKFPATENVDLDIVPKAFDMNYLVSGENFRYQASAAPIVNAAMQKLWEVGDAGPEILDQVAVDVNAEQEKSLAADPDK